MNTKGAAAASMAVLLTVGAVAPQPALARSPVEPKKQSQCFWTRNADGFAAENEHIVNIRVGVRDVWQFEFLGTCPDIDWSNRIALVSRSGSTICSGMDAEIVTRTAIGPQRCAVRSLRKLTPEEVAALPRRARP